MGESSPARMFNENATRMNKIDEIIRIVRASEIFISPVTNSLCLVLGFSLSSGRSRSLFIVIPDILARIAAIAIKIIFMYGNAICVFRSPSSIPINTNGKSKIVCSIRINFKNVFNLESIFFYLTFQYFIFVHFNFLWPFSNNPFLSGLYCCINYHFPRKIW